MQVLVIGLVNQCWADSGNIWFRIISTRWFIITGISTKSGIFLLLGYICGYNLAWLSLYLSKLNTLFTYLL